MSMIKKATMTHLPETTCFYNDALAFDPAGCGCTDCIVGDSIPLDETKKIATAIEEHFIDYREIINRTGQSLVLYRNQDDEFDFDYLYHGDKSSTVVVLEPMEKRYDPERGTFFFHSEGCPCSVCETGISSTPVDNEEKALSFADRHFIKGAVLENHTDKTIVLTRQYTEVGLQSVATYLDHPEVTVLLYGY